MKSIKWKVINKKKLWEGVFNVVASLLILLMIESNGNKNYTLRYVNQIDTEIPANLTDKIFNNF